MEFWPGEDIHLDEINPFSHQRGFVKSGLFHKG